LITLIIIISKYPRRGDKLKSWSLRIPEQVYDWVRAKAARETIRQNKFVSMNRLAVEILAKAMEADKKEGGQ
jgi:hypothetical protein